MSKLDNKRDLLHLENMLVKEASQKDHMLHDPIHMKRTEMTNP